MPIEEVSTELNQQARILWAKSGPRDSDIWLPLFTHLADTAAIARILWDNWVPHGTKMIIAKGITNLPLNTSCEERERIAGLILELSALLHDIGKATPDFQAAFRSCFFDSNGDRLAAFVEAAGLKLPIKTLNVKAIHHSLASFGILRRHGWDASFAVITGAHHGKPPSRSDIEKVVNSGVSSTGHTLKQWVIAQDSLVGWAESLVSPESLLAIKEAKLSRQTQVLLSGLLIMADWIASDKDYFPLIRIGEQARSSKKRALEAWKCLDLAPYQSFSMAQQLDTAEDIYKLRFSIAEPRPIQSAIPELLARTAQPGIMVIEAPMGEGKTEAALVAAEIMAEKTGRSGFFFALPTQATSDGMFSRIMTWAESFRGYKSISLAHGKAQFNKEFQGLGFTASNVDEGADAIFVSEWARGRKRTLLNDFVVGTIDQVLMAGLQQKHLMLRHLGLVNKVVIIDECHAYDTYMNQYLYKTLNWLGAYQVPVIVLSATLPSDSRKALVEAYLNIKPQAMIEDPLLAPNKTIDEVPSWVQSTAYPQITYTSGSNVKSVAPQASARKLDVRTEQLNDQDIVPCLKSLLESGGCAGIIVNTISRAQSLTREICEAFDEEDVMLLHSRFIAPDRIDREKKLREKLGPSYSARPEKLIVVGTQVLEQSLDIDFDVMITDLCPMDLLIQRMGRIHRHSGRTRPPLLQEPKCFITGIEGDGAFIKGSKLVYGDYLLMNTQVLLPEKITLPDDISRLVQLAYGEEEIAIPPELQSHYEEAKTKHSYQAKRAAAKAQTFQINDPSGGTFGLLATIVDWLNTDLSEKNDPGGKRAEATVRDSLDSVQVLVVQRKQNGQLYLLPQEDEHVGRLLSDDLSNNDELARELARNIVTLPVSMTTPWFIDKVITALETDCYKKLPQDWQESAWLQGELFLILDENFKAEVLIDSIGFELHYDRKYGLDVRRFERKDGGV